MEITKEEKVRLEKFLKDIPEFHKKVQESKPGESVKMEWKNTIESGKTEKSEPKQEINYDEIERKGQIEQLRLKNQARFDNKELKHGHY